MCREARVKHRVKGSCLALQAELMVIGLMIGGCSERESSPLGPSVTEAADPTDASLRAEKERNAIDLGPPSAAAPSMLSASSVSAFGATATSIPFDPEPGPFLNRTVACDDCVNNGIPIGFSFTFFGNAYTTFNISSNGFIGFSPPAMGNGCCSGGSIPNADPWNNIIAAAWTDLYPGGGGGVFYETRGRAPNRYLVVAYQDVPWCCISDITHVTTQIILYEGTNIIEIHTARQSEGHIYTQGVENATGTQAMFLPGRVASNYGLANDGVRFTTVLGAWAARAPLPSGRVSPAATALNGLLYSIGGRNSSDAALKSVLAYNPGTNSWSTRASLPAARENGNGAVAIGSTIYVAGGYDASHTLTRTLYAYNTSTNTWTTKANMPIVSACGGSAAIGGRLYVFTGCKRSSTGAQIAAGTLHRYEPATNQWTTLRSAPAVHVRPAVAAINGKLYVAGGGDESSAPTGRLDVYDPTTNTWSTMRNMPTARVATTAAVLGGKLHVIGGRSGESYLGTVEAYDPATNSWTTRASMPTRRSGIGVGVINGQAYAVGGRRSSTTVVATNERYTP